MARITIEDCLDKVENRFHLVLIASKRARQLALGGAEATISWENDKATVVALREIASGKLTFTEEGVVQATNAEISDPIPTVAEEPLVGTPVDVVPLPEEGQGDCC